ncbi:conserved hypothetical protein [Frankia canadensis]|uniref:Uncharacterized protein n=1 Tax=Frankia canadensis TaxID=1836972 RepID=A0A2I2KM73_9ACTN|nr:hypothetical protein [Frankia canadensis]SNQ46763.1 conserved hypothetical protein [Frankia canadensis]SOU54053.1 conserved hypothetical protein [Frankia canadensis]
MPERPPADQPGPGGAEQPEAPKQSAGSGPADAQPAPRSQEADDAAFFELVARFDEPVEHDPADSEPDGRRWPAAEDVGDTRRPTVIILRPPFDPGPPFGPGSPPAADDRTDPGLDEPRPLPGIGPHGLRPDDDADEVVVIDLGAAAGAGDPRDDLGDLDDPDDDHYIPPEPPPLPRIRPVTRWALGSIALGMVFLVVPSLIGLNQSRSQDVTGVMLILGGVGTLVARLGDRPPTDSDGPDDGAVI